MNREQRRKVSKQKLNHKDLKYITQQEAIKATEYTVKQYSAAVMICLHDKLGFGATRAQRFINDVSDLFDSINQGYLSLDDITRTIEQELGIRII